MNSRAKGKRGELRRVRPMEDRFWTKVEEVEDGCWLWRGALHEAGYGRFYKPRATMYSYAHRVAYELVVGVIPNGLQLDHLCRNRACVNPAHLESVTQRENLLRGETIPARNAAKTHCKHGHAFTAENTYVEKGARKCRACGARRAREKRAVAA